MKFIEPIDEYKEIEPADESRERVGGQTHDSQVTI